MSSSIAGDAQTPTVMSSRQSSQAPHMDVETLGETALEHPHGTLPGDPTPSAPTTDSTPVVTSQALQPSASEPIEQILTDATAVQPPKPKSQHKTDSSSDLSELSDAEQRRLKPPATTVIAPIVTPVVTPIVTPIITQTPSGIHQDEQGEPVHYEAGTLVWARQRKFMHSFSRCDVNLRCSWVPLVSCGCFRTTGRSYTTQDYRGWTSSTP